MSDMSDEELRAILGKIQARVDDLPMISAAIEVLQRDIRRLVRAALNDMGRTNITAGEVEAMHTGES